MSSFWIKDQDGNPSVIVTLVTLSFSATTVAYVMSIIDHIGSLSIRPFDGEAAAAYVGAVLAAYVGHKWVSSKYDATSPPAQGNG